MLLSELDFAFPQELIAQEPVEPRDSCRLMVLDAAEQVHHHVFSDLAGLLRAGDVLVLNDTRVLPARVEARKPTGGRVELLFLGPFHPSVGPGDRAVQEEESWLVLARPSHRLREGAEIALAGGERLLLARSLGNGRWVIRLRGEDTALGLLERYGVVPLPPYIRSSLGDPERYQTVYGARPGSAAAPTAGLHFTDDLLGRLRQNGIETAWVTLHVGLDTFQPIREERVEDHEIHRESYWVRADALAAIRRARRQQRRVVAVGTTSARVLETLAAGGVLPDCAATPEYGVADGDGGLPERPRLAGDGAAGGLYAAGPRGGASLHDAARQDGAAGGSSLASEEHGAVGSTELFITPGYRFQAVDALITNFHLPRSSVLALVMAFAGVEAVRKAYSEAIVARYRFFSFGDAMLIERPRTEETASCPH